MEIMIEKSMENVEIKRYETLNSAQLCKIHELYNNSFDLLKISKFIKETLILKRCNSKLSSLSPSSGP